MRRVAPFIVAIGLGVAVAALFSGPLGESSSTHRRALEEQAINDDLTSRIAAGEREIVLLGDRSFLDQLARGWGLGVERERGFALQVGAPPPPEIRPVGEDLSRDVGDGVLADLVRTIAGA